METVHEWTMQEKVANLHELIKAMFPDAVFVEIRVNSDGIDVEPRFKTKPTFYSVKNIRGEWIK